MALEDTRAADIVLNYLKGQRVYQTIADLRYLCQNSGKSCKTLLKETVCSDNDENFVTIQAISQLFSSDAETCQHLLDSSRDLYDLLTRVADEDDPRAVFLCTQINKIHSWPTEGIVLVITALLMAAGGILFQFSPIDLEEILIWFQTLPLSQLPLVTITGSSLFLLWNCYKTFVNGFFWSENKWTKLAFKGLTAGLTISGYILCYFTGGIMTPLAAMLMVLGASVDLIEIFWRTNEVLLASLVVHQKNMSFHERVKECVTRSRGRIAMRSMGINLGTALLITAAMSVWCFYPPTLFLSIGCWVFTTVVALAKHSLFAYYLENSWAQELQEDIANVFESEKTLTQMQGSDSYLAMQPILNASGTDDLLKTPPKVPVTPDSRQVPLKDTETFAFRT